jgi:hypothetical protein
MLRRRRISRGGVSQRAVALFRYGRQLRRENKQHTSLFKSRSRAKPRMGPRTWHPSIYEVVAGHR